MYSFVKTLNTNSTNFKGSNIISLCLILKCVLQNFQMVSAEMFVFRVVVGYALITLQKSNLLVGEF